jgi:hypothetical protein
MPALRDARNVYTSSWTKTSLRFGDILTKADVSHDRIGKPAEKWVAYPTLKSSLLGKKDYSGPTGQHPNRDVALFVMQGIQRTYTRGPVCRNVYCKKRGGN